MLKRIKYFFSSEAGLQVRMTLWVSMVVLIVAVVVMTVASSVLRDQYEKELREQLSDDIEATVKILDQRMQRVEYITMTAASSVEVNLDEGPEKLDAFMGALMHDIDCIDVASLCMDNRDDSTATIYNAYNAEMHGGRHVVSFEPLQKCLAKDENWIASFHEGRNLWSVLFSPEGFSDVRLQCFSVPIYAADTTRVGMMCTMIKESFIGDMIAQYKTRKDIDLTVYDREGQCIVEPDDYVLRLAPEDLIVEERPVARLQWRIVFSADRHIITNRLKPLMWIMLGTLVLLLICIAIVIALVVRYVARPFVQKQEQVASAKASMERDLQIAAETQQAFVPHVFPPFPDRKEVSIYACLNPAREVGGDMYDYFIKDDKYYFCLGDVSGKGMPASFFMAATLYLFRFVAAEMPASDAVRKMNELLCIDNEKCTFVTFFLGCLDLRTGLLEYCNAGHNSPILLHEGETRYFAPSESMPLGVWEDNEYPSETIQLSKGDIILLYTDGVTEAMNAKSEEFGEERTLKCVNGCTPKEPKPIIDTVLEQIRQHAADSPQSDDITMLCIGFNKTTK